MNVHVSIIVSGVVFFAVLSCGDAAVPLPPARTALQSSGTVSMSRRTKGPVYVVEGGKSYLVKMPRINCEALTNHGVQFMLPRSKIVITRLNGGRISFQMPMQANLRVSRTNERHTNDSAFCLRVNPGLFSILNVPVDPKIDPIQAPLPLLFAKITAAPANGLPASPGMKAFHGMMEPPHARQVRHMKLTAGPLRAFGR